MPRTFPQFKAVSVAQNSYYIPNLHRKICDKCNRAAKLLALRPPDATPGRPLKLLRIGDFAMTYHAAANRVNTGVLLRTHAAPR